MKVIVETAQGEGIWRGYNSYRFVGDEKIIEPLKKVIRIANGRDHKHYEECRRKEKEALLLAKRR